MKADNNVLDNSDDEADEPVAKIAHHTYNAVTCTWEIDSDGEFNLLALSMEEAVPLDYLADILENNIRDYTQRHTVA